MTNEQKEQFTKALHSARRRRDEIVQERETLDEELVQQSRAIAALAELLGESSDTDIGLTGATQLVIGTSKKPLTPPEIRDELKKIGYHIDHFSNPMASLHQVLKRLEDRGSIGLKYYPDGKKRFFGRTRIERTVEIPEKPDPVTGLTYTDLHHAEVARSFNTPMSPVKDDETGTVLISSESREVLQKRNEERMTAARKGREAAMKSKLSKGAKSNNKKPRR